jgi:hypothetical protein
MDIAYTTKTRLFTVHIIQVNVPMIGPLQAEGIQIHGIDNLGGQMRLSLGQFSVKMTGEDIQITGNLAL